MADRGKTLSSKLIQETKDDVISIGEVYKGVCDAGMAPSTITIVSNDLNGYGDDYFNTDWVMLVLYNYNSHGAAPEGEVRDITDYTSLTGTFTTQAFSANIEPDDIVMVAYTKHYQFATSAELFDTSGPTNIEIDDVGTYNLSIYDVGNVVPTSAEITAGNYQIDRLRAGALTNIVPSAAASKADGRIYAVETFDEASGWAIGDLVLVTFSGGSIGISGVTTVLPNQYFWTRITREESIQTQIEYGIVSVEADAGTTSTNIIDAASLTQATDDWWRGALLLSINGQNEGQSRPIISFSAATDSVDVYPAFLNTPDAGDAFIVISSWRPSLFDQQPDVAVTVNAVLISETDIFDLNVAGTTYQVNNLRLKSVDPGAETITVRLRELINDVSTIVDTFTIDTTNFGTYYSLMDMFGLPQLTGDDIQVTVQASAAGPYAITGQYQHSLSNSG